MKTRNLFCPLVDKRGFFDGGEGGIRPPAGGLAEKEGFARLRAGRLGLQGAPGALPSALGSNPSMR